MKKCPFLEEVIMRYCTACATRKMIPSTEQETVCTGEKHLNCELFKEIALGESNSKEEDMKEKDRTYEENPALKGNSTFFPPYWAKICKHESCPVCAYRGMCYGSEVKWMNEPVPVKGLVIRRNLYFSKGHTWVKVRKNETVKIGVDDFGQKLLGKVREVNPFSEDEIKKGETFLKIKSNMGEVNLPSPVNGKVTRINEKLLDDSSLMNSDPYGKGWAVEIELPEPEQELKRLIRGTDAREWMVTEIDRLSQRMEEDLGVTVADGGTLVNTIENIDKTVWENLVKDFFTI